MKDIFLIEIKNGSRRAFYEAYHAWHPKLYQYIYKYTRSAYYAEETVQLTFIRLWEKRATLSEQYSLSTQLFRIAKSTLIDLTRKEERRNCQELSDSFVAGGEESLRLQHKEDLQRALAAIERLPEQSAKVFRLSRLEELSHKEIGRRLSISPKTVEVHITKALKLLRKAFF